ncbi:hypothetical protein [Pseudomonas sp.]|uniref:hypothetical protein n=1 Tax=Pseudomonas sp. TaxID=306 RepID=UPI00272A67DA|nr:hypothetical protein [Pseudomonas sp.]
MSYIDIGDQGLVGLFQRLPIACVLVRASACRALAVNDAFRTLFGWQDHQIVGLESRDLPVWTSPEQREALLDVLACHGCINNRDSLRNTSRR